LTAPLRIAVIGGGIGGLAAAGIVDAELPLLLLKRSFPLSLLSSD
jgi:hypothetical protein